MFDRVCGCLPYGVANVCNGSGSGCRCRCAQGRGRRSEGSWRRTENRTLDAYARATHECAGDCRGGRVSALPRRSDKLPRARHFPNTQIDPSGADHVSRMRWEKNNPFHANFHLNTLNKNSLCTWCKGDGYYKGVFSPTINIAADPWGVASPESANDPWGVASPESANP